MQIIIIDSAEALAEQTAEPWQGEARKRVYDTVLSCLHPIEVPSDAEDLVKAVLNQIAFGECDEIIDFSEAAALITAHSRTVPRAMLSRVASYVKGMMDWNGEIDDDLFIDEIAKEFGYHAE